MKKLRQLTAILSFIFILGGCSSTQTKTAVQTSFTITLNEEGKELSSKELTFTEGDFLQEVMEEHFDIIEESGMVSSIDGHASDAAKKKYWLYEVNGEMPSVGAKEFELNEDDVVVWNLDVLDF